MCPEGQNDQWEKIGTHLKTNNLKFRGIHKHNQKKIIPPKPQIISYCPSIIDIKHFYILNIFLAISSQHKQS